MEPSRLSVADVRALLQLAEDRGPGATEALAALVRLPLSDEAWREVGSICLRILDDGDFGEDPKALISSIARVPIREIRDRLHRMLEERGPLRLSVAAALAAVDDAKAGPVLADFVVSGEDVARSRAAVAGARIGFGERADEVARLARRTSDEDLRFYASLGLAHDGQVKPLRKELARLSRKGGFHVLKSHPVDPLLWDEQLEAVCPLDPVAVEYLESRLEERPTLTRRLSLGGRREQLRSLAWELLDAHQRSVPSAQDEGDQPVKPPSEAPGTQAATDLVKGIMTDQRFTDDYETWDPGEQVIWDRVEELRSAFVSLPAETASEFATWAVRAADPDRIDVGNLIVDLVGTLREPFQPDIEALVDEYTRFREGGGVNLGWQVAWLISRAPLDEVLHRVAPRLEGPPRQERVWAANLIEEVARYRGQRYGPQFGGGTPPGEVAVAATEGLISMEPSDQALSTKAVEELEASPRQVTNGFSTLDDPASPLDPDIPLLAGHRYFFWVHIGLPQRGGIDVEPVEIPAVVPADADLDVVVFSVDGGIRLDTERSGTIRVSSTQPPTVLAQPSSRPVPDIRGRLFFSLLTPQTDGRYALRCNIYYRQILVQSHLIETHVASQPMPTPGALSARLDFALAASVDPSWLADRKGHLLSLMVNDNGDGTHGFMYMAAGEDEIGYASQARFQEGEIDDYVTSAREALRLAAFGHAGPFEPDWEGDFKYRSEGDHPDLAEDLIRMAVRGYRIYRSITHQLAPPSPMIDAHTARIRLQNLMRRPGLVQIVTKVSPTLYLPAAIIYDYPLDDAVEPSGLCNAFESALAQGHDLLDMECFAGACPSYGQTDRVCPSGFWGYRHAIGLPVSMPTSSDGTTVCQDAAAHVYYERQPIVAVAVATDLADYEGHIAHLRTMPGITVESPARSRREALDLLSGESPHVVYFYCHGGKQDTLPYLRVGSGDEHDYITPANVMDNCYWPSTRPLVIINGCYTTGIGPEEASQFVSAFTGEPMASGVIGTETAIVEELATRFAETLLGEFITIPYDELGSYSIGEAVRRTRLRLLGWGNPLGLLYVPFVSPDLDIKPTLKAMQPSKPSMR